jgi:hypothetical protein
MAAAQQEADEILERVSRHDPAILQREVAPGRAYFVPAGVPSRGRLLVLNASNLVVRIEDSTLEVFRGLE